MKMEQVAEVHLERHRIHICKQTEINPSLDKAEHRFNENQESLALEVTVRSVFHHQGALLDAPFLDCHHRSGPDVARTSCTVWASLPSGFLESHGQHFILRCGKREEETHKKPISKADWYNIWPSGRKLLLLPGESRRCLTFRG